MWSASCSTDGASAAKSANFSRAGLLACLASFVALVTTVTVVSEAGRSFGDSFEQSQSTVSKLRCAVD